ncbi:MAG: metal-dependent transcriptional regulator [Promethearchaeota archaeon]
MEKVSESIEDYLKAIYLSSKKKKGGWVSNSNIASFLSINPASVSTMLHKLKRNELIQWKPRSSLRLTQTGKEIAKKLVKNYNCLYFFFKEILHINNTVLVEHMCCKIEHHITTEVSIALSELISFKTTKKNKFLNQIS